MAIKLSPVHAIYIMQYIALATLDNMHVKSTHYFICLLLRLGWVALNNKKIGRSRYEFYIWNLKIIRLIEDELE